MCLGWCWGWRINNRRNKRHSAHKHTFNHINWYTQSFLHIHLPQTHEHAHTQGKASNNCSSTDNSRKTTEHTFKPTKHKQSSEKEVLSVNSFLPFPHCWFCVRYVVSWVGYWCFIFCFYYLPKSFITKVFFLQCEFFFCFALTHSYAN